MDRRVERDEILEFREWLGIRQEETIWIVIEEVKLREQK